MLYLDCNATTPIEPEVLDLMVHYFRDEYGNAGSRSHLFGRNALTAVKAARAQVGRAVAADADDVVFTSGATEANNLALLGLEEFGKAQGRTHIISTTVEHKAVLEPIKHLSARGFSVDLISPDETGRVQAQHILEKVRSDTLVVSILHANNETGVLQPVQEIADGLAGSAVYLHVDGVQSLGKRDDALSHPRIDLVSLSAHKVYGPKGIGALILRKRGFKRAPLRPLMFGGGQERGLRPGTVPVALAAGFGLACDIAIRDRATRERTNTVTRASLTAALQGIDYTWNGDPANVLPHVANLAFRGVDSEALMVSLKEKMAFSNGAACTSQSYERSHVLRAMGLSEARISSSIRLSWSHFSSQVDWTPLAQAVQRLAASARGRNDPA